MNRKLLAALYLAMGLALPTHGAFAANADGSLGGRLTGTGETVALAADQIFKAIGQSFEPSALNGSGPAIELRNGRIWVDPEGRTSMPGVWAGGDCIFGGDDLTVSAVAQGRDAAESIHRTLSA